MGSPVPAIHPPVSNVFVYGSLLSDDVVCALLSRVPRSAPAILPNYQRFSIKERVYPAIIPAEDKKVHGKVLLDITPPELHILDVFEDVEYERTTVDVCLEDSSEKLKAYTYVWENKTDPDLNGEWNFEDWKVLHMKDFLKMTTDFVEEMELPDPKTRVATYESFYKGADNDPPNP
ncbi:AIG2-like (avirulence induced gene) family protein [Striga hermonthica]|uniref:Putative gamma-glutamylcyclotransferase n=1 Tax=Striga hermonthica TaxID=68872 RepID=A0A9N7P056_STRHE|nr:AIG2-like (avirulence induced gene) family protein [Striga hermonthica]